MTLDKKSTEALYQELKRLNKIEETLDILKPRIKLVDGTLTNDGETKDIVWIQSSGFVFKNSKEYQLLSEVLHNADSGI